MLKGALNAVTRALAIEYAKEGISVNTIAPGVINTPMHKPETHDSLKRLHPVVFAGFDRCSEKNGEELPPDIEIESGWNACVASMARPATQQRIKTLIERGFCKPGDAENRLGDFVGR